MLGNTMDIISYEWRSKKCIQIRSTVKNITKNKSVRRNAIQAKQQPR